MPTPIFSQNSFQPLTNALKDPLNDWDSTTPSAPAIDFGTTPTGGVHRRKNISGSMLFTGHADLAREMSDIGRYLRRLNEQVQAALNGEDDSLARDEAIRDGLPYWGLAYERRKFLKAPQREFLNHLLTCLTSLRAVQDTVALSMLNDVITQFVSNLYGTTEKDVVSWIARLREAGFNLFEPLTTEFQGEAECCSTDDIQKLKRDGSADE